MGGACEIVNKPYWMWKYCLGAQIRGMGGIAISKLFNYFLEIMFTSWMCILSMKKHYYKMWV